MNQHTLEKKLDYLNHFQKYVFPIIKQFEPPTFL